MRNRALEIAGVEARITLALFAALSFALAFAQPAWADDAASSSAAAVASVSSASAAASSDAAASSASSASSDESASSEAAAPIITPDGEAVQVEGENNRLDPTQRADNSFLYDTTIDSLFSQASLYENKIVQVSGEVIGDIVIEDPVGRKHCWITLTSTEAENPATISVVISNDQASQIDHLGRYGVTGTTLQVRGVYHQACSEHEGIPDIHATTASVLVRGSEHPDKFEFENFIPGIIAIALGLALMGVYVFLRERSR